tara:strand:- start:5548 stop:5772 length:225 start_codon:yes stop_codon:yes gene_type:complete
MKNLKNYHSDKLDEVIELIWNVRGGIEKELKIDDVCDIICEHEKKEYQPAEPENNVGEDYFCYDCGRDFTEELV